MQAGYWQQLWDEGRIGFHQADGNPKLRTWLPSMDLAPGARIFLPLCGKTRDVAWLLSQGFAVAGAELSELAVEQLFSELSVVPDVERSGELVRYSTQGLDIFAGDIFDLSHAVLGPVDAVFDRAAIVALPPDMRARYAAHMAALTRVAPQLMMTFEYDQTRMDGPPFSVPAAEVKALHDSRYHVRLLESSDVQGNLKGRIEALDHVWQLTPISA